MFRRKALFELQMEMCHADLLTLFTPLFCRFNAAERL